MNVSLTPKKDYVEGDNSVPDMIIPAQSYINAQMTNNWYVSVGSNYYFKTRNERIHPYLGGALGFQMARIQICPKGFDKYNASHHNIKIFEMPVVKLGFRF